MRGDVVPLARGGLEEDTDLLWRALADPTRRRILDLLRQRPLITGEIAAQFPVTRIAVMRHLEVLSEAGLVTSRKRGRERWHYLNAVPLQRLHRRWADPAAAGFASALLRLADTVEAEGRHMQSNRPTIDVALDIENHYAEEFPHLPKNVRDLLQTYVDAGKLGVKTGEGFYTYPGP